MTEPAGQQTPRSAEGVEPHSVEGLRSDIERTRSELAETVDELAAKLDVKSQATDKLHQVRGRVIGFGNRAKQAVPDPIRHALDKGGATIGPIVESAANRAKPYRKQILAGASTGFGILLALRAKRNSRRRS